MSSLLSPYETAPIANLLDYFCSLRRYTTVEYTEMPGLFRYQSQIAHPWFNDVIISRPPADGETEFIHSQLDYFRKKGVSSFTWWLETAQLIEAWGIHLQPHGFKISHEPPGMVCELKDLPLSVPVSTNFSIRIVENPSMFNAWVDTFVLGYGLPEDFIKPLVDLFGGSGMQEDTRYFLGYLDEEPVAASTVFFSNGMAGIYNVGVKPSARRKGFGAAITLAPLLPDNLQLKLRLA